MELLEKIMSTEEVWFNSWKTTNFCALVLRVVFVKLKMDRFSLIDIAVVHNIIYKGSWKTKSAKYSVSNFIKSAL